ncbi:MAG: CRISPR-associated endonuclease Cas1 [Nannocystaceae bacterium]|nr:CRISPR-associated endonuclease Cas1 [Nannocystaceae bacterium]
MTTSITHAPANVDADLIPVRMCNELVYCPRLFHLEHVQGMFVHSADTVEGSSQHERAKRRGSRLRVVKDKPAPDPRTADELFGLLPKRRLLTSEAIGVRGEIDAVEVTDGSVVAVETKHGKAPRWSDHSWQDHVLPYDAWPADVAQLALYMALLRDLGLPCDEGRLYYRASHKSVVIPWSDDLERFVTDVVGQARKVARLPIAPEPLLDSPKCPGCSLHDVCLPDEHHALKAEQTRASTPLRRIVAGDDDRAIVHVLRAGTVVRKDGEGLVVTPREGESERFLLKDVAHLALFGRVHVTEPCMQHMLRTGTPVSHHTATGRLLGVTMPLMTRNVALRRAQYRVADDPDACLAVSKAIVVAKIRNQRTVLRRHRRGLSVVVDDRQAHEASDDADEEAAVSLTTGSEIANALTRMNNAQRGALETTTIDALRGFEGEAAARYFEVLPALLPTAWQGDFTGRSRRPPRDRINAMLSLGYALLVRDATAALSRIGLDPMLGVFHSMIPGRPALALDIMEPFRAAWVDTAVLRLVGTGGIERSEFHLSGAGVELSDAGRRSMVAAYERRAAEMTTHPRFGYRMSYRRLLELEARILAKVLAGELEHYTPMWTR